jgi:hypothetical protein
MVSPTSYTVIKGDEKIHDITGRRLCGYVVVAGRRGLGGSRSPKVRVDWCSSVRHVEEMGEVGLLPSHGREAGYRAPGEGVSVIPSIFRPVPVH